MAYKYNYGEVDQGESSQFNAGLLQMKRIHETQDLLNRANLNPQSFNDEVGVYNFEIIISSINSLLNESSPKLGSVERVEAEAMRDAIRFFLNKYPIYELKNGIKGGNSRASTKFNEKNWKVLQKQIIIYETLVRRLLDKHELNSPNKRDDEGL